MRKKQVNEKASYDKPETIISEETILESSLLKSKSTVQVSGKFIGDIQVESSLVVSQSGEVTGNVTASFVLVAGVINGNVDASKQIHITKTGRVLGDIICQSIVIDEGGSIEGKCKMKETVSNIKDNKPAKNNNKEK